VSARQASGVAALVAVLGGGCMAYNADCPPDDTPVAGYTEVPLDVRLEVLRTQEAALGDLIADAFHEHLRIEGVDLTVVNAGSIRNRTRCETVDTIEPGPITTAQLTDLLPFANDVVMVQASGRELRAALEHSVSRLGEPGVWGLAGQFLQVSHVRFAVDCSRTAAVGAEIIGSRIAGDIVLLRDNGAEEVVVPDGSYRIVTNSFIASGGDGYEWLTSLVPRDRSDPAVGVVNRYLADADDPSTEAIEGVAPQVEGRIVIDPNCGR